MSDSAMTTAGGMRREILAIALPSMLTNVATALFGLADLWVIGRLGDAAAQGAVEVGAKLLMTLLVVFNFLRTGVVALTAQAAGRGDENAQAATLARGLAAALAIAAAILLARTLAIPLGLKLLGASPSVAALARTYVGIRYWGAVPWLINAVLAGWMIGRRRVRAVLAVEVGSNLIHVALDVGLVLGLGLGVAGVAAATLTSETAKCVALVVMVAREAPGRRALAVAREPATWRRSALIEVFRLNRDLFGRTVLLMAATVLLTRAGARQGAVILAANAILYQLFMLSALLLDGFESAAQVLCGEALGGADRPRFDRAVRTSLILAGAFAALIALLYALGGERLAGTFSTAPGVVAAARVILPWAVVLPLVGVASYVLDGVFIGAGWTRAMLITMAAALTVFVLALAAVRPLGNPGLWLAFCLFLAARAVGQAVLAPGLARRAFSGRARLRGRRATAGAN